MLSFCLPNRPQRSTAVRIRHGGLLPFFCGPWAFESVTEVKMVLFCLPDAVLSPASLVLPSWHVQTRHHTLPLSLGPSLVLSKA